MRYGCFFISHQEHKGFTKNTKMFFVSPAVYENNGYENGCGKPHPYWVASQARNDRGVRGMRYGFNHKDTKSTKRTQRCFCVIKAWMKILGLRMDVASRIPTGLLRKLAMTIGCYFRIISLRTTTLQIIKEIILKNIRIGGKHEKDCFLSRDYDINRM